jgi:hypothetical protein
MNKAATTAEGEIEDAFAIKGRGWALLLKEGFRGNIHKNGIVESDRGSAPYTGPEFADSRTRSLLAVIVAEGLKETFVPGQKVRFYRQPSR